MLQSGETENESDEPNNSRGRPGEGEDKRLMRMTKCRLGQGRLKRTRLLSWKVLGEEFQAEGPEGWTGIRVGLLECSGEPQPRARGTQGSESCLRDSWRESTCHQHWPLERGWEHVAEMWGSEWGLLFLSPWQPNFGTNICSTVPRERKIWQAW